MFTQKDVDILNEALPSNAIMDIHKKTTISRPTIYRFLNGCKIRTFLQEKIYIAALEVIEEEKIRLQRIKKKRSRILKEVLE